MGQLITPNSSLAAPGGGAGASGTGFGTNRAAVALPAGATNNLNPSPGPPIWPTGYGRLILTAGAGVANVTGLVAGVNGQPLFVFNNDPANAITLNSQNAGSLAANRFAFVADLVLSPGDGVFIMYDTPIGRWLLT